MSETGTESIHASYLYIVRMAGKTPGKTEETPQSHTPILHPRGNAAENKRIKAAETRRTNWSDGVVKPTEILEISEEKRTNEVFHGIQKTTKTS